MTTNIPVRFFEQPSAPVQGVFPGHSIIVVPSVDGTTVTMYHLNKAGFPRPVGATATVATINASNVIEDANHRFMTDAEKAQAKRFEHTQASASATWNINHNLGFYPVIRLLTVGGVEFEADVSHVSVNQATVTLATALAGLAICS